MNTPRPRPSRERGRPAIRAMAYQRAMADIREAHRDEFNERLAYHKQMLTQEGTCQRSP